MKPDEIIKMAANGNQQAEDLARAWYAFCRLTDDNYDKDIIVTDDRMAVVCVQFMTEMCGNEFFIQHRAMFYGVMVASFNAWLDSNRKDGIERSVLSGMYHEVVYLVAFMTGGWQHMRHVSSECREYKPRKESNHGALS